MTFYEAKTLGDVRKVVDFISEQPYMSVPRLCMNPLLRQLTPDYAMAVLSEGADLGPDIPLTGFHLFWVEDENKRIRAAIFILFKDIPFPQTKYTSVAQAAFCCVDNNDYENDVSQYFEELCLGMIRQYGKDRIGEFRVTGRFYGWLQKIFGDHATTIRHDVIPNITTKEPMEVWLVKIEWQHLLGT